jgi:uncharacterized membrane protein YkoI
MQHTRRFLLASGLLVAACGGGASVQQSVGSAESAPTQTAAAADDDDTDDGDDAEERVELSAVPDAIKNAALTALPGLVLTGAERETEDGRVVYGLEGTVNGVPWEVEVAADGTVLEVESEDDDDR